MNNLSLALMSLPVIPLMVAGSLGLVSTFVILFIADRRRHRGSAERDSLLPLNEEVPQIAHDSHEPDPHDSDGCGCHSGHRAPCAGCLKRPASSSLARHRTHV